VSKKKPVTPAKPLKEVVKKDYTRLWEILAILLICFAVYGNSIKNGYNLDDAYVVSLDETNPQTAKGIKGIPEILSSPYNVGEGVTYGYRPLGKVTMAIEYSLWGNNPHYSHVVNILLYALNIFLLLFFIRKIAALFGYKNEFVIYASLLLFALHPIHTEVVNSIKNREEILCFIFMLSAILLFFKYYEERMHILIIPIAFLTLLAFLSKQTAVNILGIMVLYVLFRAWILRVDFSGSISPLFKYDLNKVIWHIMLPVAIFNVLAIGINAVCPEIDIADSFSKILVLIVLYPVVVMIRSRNNNFVSPHKRISLRWYLSIWFFWMLINAVIVSKVYDHWGGVSLVIFSLVSIVMCNLIAISILHIIAAMIKRGILYVEKRVFIRNAARLSLAIFTVIIITILSLRYLPEKAQQSYESDIIEVAFEQTPYAFAPDATIFPNGMQTLFFYICKLMVPYPLGFYYGYDMLPVKDWNSIYPYLGIILLMLTGVFVVYSMLFKKYRFLSFWILLFGALLFPFLNLMKYNQVTGIVGERLAYQASFAFCVILAMTVYASAEFVHGKLVRSDRITAWKLSSFFLLIFLLPYTILTAKRNTQWLDTSTLFRHDIKYLSNSARANFMMAGNYMIEWKKLPPDSPGAATYVEQASLYLDRAISIYPKYDAALLSKGLLLFENYNNPDSAMVYLRRVSDKRNIDHVRALELMGDISYLSYKDKEAAFQYYQEAFGNKKPDEVLYNKIMQVLFELMDFDRIFLYAGTGINLGWPHAYIDRADAYYYSGDTVNAIEDYEAAINAGIRTAVLANKLANIYMQTGDTIKFNWLKRQMLP
jgi:hypothetical protein